MTKFKLKLLVIHGPNLNLLGTREVGVYGKLTLIALNRLCRKRAVELGTLVRFYQSNHEGKLIDVIHRNRGWAHGIVINPAALTHYSYALRDALSAVNLPAVEVHLSDIKKREPFRKKSVVRAVCLRQISGFGPQSYLKGIEFLATHFRG
jgi:3-dehydroquinate dehydratase-2